MSSTLPTQINGRYQLYKARTARLVNWLITAANACSKGAKSIISDGEPVRTHQLLELAQIIHSAEPPPKIPIQVLKLASRVIEGRRFCSQWYSVQSRPENSKQNESHQHFITVLEDLYSILKEAGDRYMKSIGAACAQTHNTPLTREDDFLFGPYSALDVEDPSEDALGTGPKRKAKRSHHQATPLQNNPRDEKDLALWCFLKDMHDTRLFVRQAWVDFQDGQISFFVASSIANVAFGIMRHANRRMNEEHSGFSNYGNVLAFLGLKCAIVQGRIVVLTNDGENSIDDTRYSELFCPKAAHLVYYFQALWNEGGGRGLSRAEALAMWPYHQFGVELLQLIPEIDRLKELDDTKYMDYFGDDEFAAAVCNLKGTKRVPVWFIVACQSIMDAYDVLGDRLGVGVRIFCQAAHRSKASMVQCERIRMEKDETMICDSQFNRFKSLCEPDYQLARALTAGETEGCPSDEELDTSTSHVPEDVPRVLFWKIPTLCGGRVRAQNLKMHYVSVRLTDSLGIANDILVISAMAHFYKAAQYYGLLTREWPDMDWFIKRHSEERPYVRDVGLKDNPHWWERNFLVAVGLHCEITNPKVITKRICARTVRSGSRFTRALLEEAFADMTLGIHRCSATEHILRGIAESSQTSRGSKNSATAYTGQQLLATYREVVLADELEMNFGYVGFWNLCVKLLEDIKEVVEKLSSTALLLRVPPRESADFMIVLALLNEAADAKQGTGSAVATTFALAARHCLNRTIASDGDRFTKAAYYLSSKCTAAQTSRERNHQPSGDTAAR